MRVGRIELLFVARLLFVFVLWLERFVLAARGAAEVVPGWASMLAVPLCGTALRCTGQLRWLRNSRPAGTQTCSPSPCLQQGANLN
jgi:hypothetical protein